LAPRTAWPVGLLVFFDPVLPTPHLEQSRARLDRRGTIQVVSEEDPERDDFEKLRALAREVGQSIERAAGRLDLDGIADRIGTGGERIRELAEFTGQWLNHQLEPDARGSAGRPGPGEDHPRLERAGPHPLDVPTEEQALVLGALDSGRWKVEPGTDELTGGGDGPSPSDRAGVVSELRARDWIAASGALTVLGRAALERWGESSRPS